MVVPEETKHSSASRTASLARTLPELDMRSPVIFDSIWAAARSI